MTNFLKTFEVVSCQWRRWLAAGVVCLLPGTTFGQLIYQEGFNDDGDGTRYEMVGRGQLVGPDGPGAWEHSFLVNEIGLPSTAPARRAAILWLDDAIEDDFTEASTTIWTNLINYMLDGKEAATVGFLPNALAPSSEFLAVQLEDAGHSITDIDGNLPSSRSVDLIIHTQAANPPSPTDLVAYRVPVISYNAGNHDDTLLSSIGGVTTGGPDKITILDVDHPVLEGVDPGEVQWIDEFIADSPLQGIGVSQPGGATPLATYVDPESGRELPALTIIESGANLLGAFAPEPEGAGFIIGGDLNLDFGNGPASDAEPVSVTLNPVDVSAHTDVKVAIDLAATDVDFESPDFLRVSYGEDPEGDFTTLAQFDGMAPGVLVHPELGELNPNSFTEFVFDIPDDVDNLVVRVEAFSTFPNEVAGIDNIRIFTGSLEVPLDCNGDGVVDAMDLDCTNAAGETSELLAALNLLPGDLDGQDGVGFPDFLILSDNFGKPLNKYTEGDIDGMDGVGFPDFLVLSDNFGKAGPAAASAVPEPHSFALIAMALGLFAGLRRRR